MSSMYSKHNCASTQRDPCSSPRQEPRSSTQHAPLSSTRRDKLQRLRVQKQCASTVWKAFNDLRRKDQSPLVALNMWEAVSLRAGENLLNEKLPRRLSIHERFASYPKDETLLGLNQADNREDDVASLIGSMGSEYLVIDEVGESEGPANLESEQETTDDVAVKSDTEHLQYSHKRASRKSCNVSKPIKVEDLQKKVAERTDMANSKSQPKLSAKPKKRPRSIKKEEADSTTFTNKDNHDNVKPTTSGSRNAPEFPNIPSEVAPKVWDYHHKESPSGVWEYNHSCEPVLIPSSSTDSGTENGLESESDTAALISGAPTSKTSTASSHSARVDTSGIPVTGSEVTITTTIFDTPTEDDAPSIFDTPTETSETPKATAEAPRIASKSPTTQSNSPTTQEVKSGATPPEQQATTCKEQTTTTEEPTATSEPPTTQYAICKAPKPGTCEDQSTSEVLFIVYPPSSPPHTLTPDLNSLAPGDSLTQISPLQEESTTRGVTVKMEIVSSTKEDRVEKQNFTKDIEEELPSLGSSGCANDSWLCDLENLARGENSMHYSRSRNKTTNNKKSPSKSDRRKSGEVDENQNIIEDLPLVIDLTKDDSVIEAPTRSSLSIFASTPMMLGKHRERSLDDDCDITKIAWPEKEIHELSGHDEMSGVESVFSDTTPTLSSATPGLSSEEISSLAGKGGALSVLRNAYATDTSHLSDESKVPDNSAERASDTITFNQGVDLRMSNFASDLLANYEALLHVEDPEGSENDVVESTSLVGANDDNGGGVMSGTHADNQPTAGKEDADLMLPLDQQSDIKQQNHDLKVTDTVLHEIFTDLREDTNNVASPAMEPTTHINNGDDTPPDSTPDEESEIVSQEEPESQDGRSTVDNISDESEDEKQRNFLERLTDHITAESAPGIPSNQSALELCGEYGDESSKDSFAPSTNTNQPEKEDALSEPGGTTQQEEESMEELSSLRLSLLQKLAELSDKDDNEEDEEEDNEEDEERTNEIKEEDKETVKYPTSSRTSLTYSDDELSPETECSDDEFRTDTDGGSVPGEIVKIKQEPQGGDIPDIPVENMKIKQEPRENTSENPNIPSSTVTSGRETELSLHNKEQTLDSPVKQRRSRWESPENTNDEATSVEKTPEPEQKRMNTGKFWEEHRVEGPLDFGGLYSTEEVNHNKDEVIPPPTGDRIVLIRDEHPQNIPVPMETNVSSPERKVVLVNRPAQLNSGGMETKRSLHATEAGPIYSSNTSPTAAKSPHVTLKNSPSAVKNSPAPTKQSHENMLKATKQHSQVDLNTKIRIEGELTKTPVKEQLAMELKCSLITNVVKRTRFLKAKFFEVSLEDTCEVYVNMEEKRQAELHCPDLITRCVSLITECDEKRRHLHDRRSRMAKEIYDTQQQKLFEMQLDLQYVQMLVFLVKSGGLTLIQGLPYPTSVLAKGDFLWLKRVRLHHELVHTLPPLEDQVFLCSSLKSLTDGDIDYKVKNNLILRRRTILRDMLTPPKYSIDDIELCLTRLKVYRQLASTNGNKWSCEGTGHPYFLRAKIQSLHKNIRWMLRVQEDAAKVKSSQSKTQTNWKPPTDSSGTESPIDAPVISLPPATCTTDSESSPEKPISKRHRSDSRMDPTPVHVNISSPDSRHTSDSRDRQPVIVVDSSSENTVSAERSHGTKTGRRSTPERRGQRSPESTTSQGSTDHWGQRSSDRRRHHRSPDYNRHRSAEGSTRERSRSYKGERSRERSRRSRDRYSSHVARKRCYSERNSDSDMDPGYKYSPGSERSRSSWDRPFTEIKNSDGRRSKHREQSPSPQGRCSDKVRRIGHDLDREDDRSSNTDTLSRVREDSDSERSKMISPIRWSNSSHKRKHSGNKQADFLRRDSSLERKKKKVPTATLR